MAEELLETAHGGFRLRRRHTPPSSPLRAWSAADELVLAHERLTDAGGQLLVVNDAWGALSVSLAAASPSVWSDSALAFDSIEANLARNDLTLAEAWRHPGDRIPELARADTVAMVVPKSADLLDAQLRGIASLLAPDGVLIAGVMARHMSRGTVNAFEAVFESVEVSRAVRKARTIVASGAQAQQSGSPLEPTHAYTTDEGVKVMHAPGVFSRGHLDIGTALLLTHLGDEDLVDRIGAPGATTVDLGCGSGVIAATLAMRHDNAHVRLLDVSMLAIASATATWQANGLASDRAVFEAADGLDSVASASIDVVVTNPPFHQDHAVDAGLTDRLLRETARVLRPGGVAVVVAQRHLRVDQRARRWFDAVDVRSGHPSHVVMVCTL